MNLITFNRIIKSGFTSFFRNIWVSLAATSMVTITLFIISTIIILYTLTVLSINNSTDKVGVVTAYFNDQTTEKEIQNIKAELETLTQVKEVTYTPKTQAKLDFIARHQNDPKLLETLNEFKDSENPVPASIAIKAVNLSDYQSVYNIMKGDRFTPFFSKIRDNQKVIDKLYKIIQFITRFGVVLAGIFILVTILVTFNTIRLTIYNRREELEIMRLVGATNGYIRGPFFVEGAIYAILATIFTSIVIFATLYLLSDKISQFLSLNSLGSTLIEALFWKITLINLFASLFLTIVASSIAMRRYLRI